MSHDMIVYPKRLESSRSDQLDDGVQPLISVVIETRMKANMLQDLLETVVNQTTDFGVEVIVADYECLEETPQAVKHSFSTSRLVEDEFKSYAYVQLCHNHGRAKGNIIGWVNPKSKWLLFLSEEVVLHPGFLRHMMDMGNSKPQAGAVGCMILNENGNEVLEAGNVVWSNALTVAYATGRRDIDSPDLTYARPVDYVSGACLMIQSNILRDYGGFKHDVFPNFYEDADIQMHVQHDLGKDVWFQPLAKVNRHKQGKLLKSPNVELQEKAAKVLRAKWRKVLERDHLPPPRSEQMVPLLLELARDTRLRKSDRSNILYIDDRIPNPSQGSGYARAYENLEMISDLGHFVTVTALGDPPDWCMSDCVQNLETKIGVEVIRPRHG